MAVNPNPARITNEMWWLWEQFKAFEPEVLLGGIYANKSGYHNTRAANDASWPGNYSVTLGIDRLGPSDKAAAIDLTFPSAQRGDYRKIALYSKRLLEAGVLGDSRGNWMREFYGNADLDTAVEGWDYYYNRAASSDSSHLWHIHISIHRKYVNNLAAMTDILSILKGGAVATPVTGGLIMLCKKGDTGLAVGALQHLLNVVEPANPIKEDGVYDTLTAAKLARVMASVGWPVDGNNYLRGEYERLLAAHTLAVVKAAGLGAEGPKGDKGDPGEPGVVPEHTHDIGPSQNI